MFRRLSNLVCQLIVLALVIFAGTAAWIIFDGNTDRGDRADCAVVLGNAVRSDGVPGSILRERLDRALELYKAGKFPLIIVSGASHAESHDEATGMAQYLEASEVPASAIVEDHTGINTEATAKAVAGIMKARHLTSVMVISHYYHITRSKLALSHEGIQEIDQAHAGSLNENDAFSIGREVIAFYDYLFNYYLRPAAEKAKLEAQAAAEKARQETDSALEKAKDKASENKR